MGLSSDHIPLSRSLRERVLERFDPGASAADNTLETADLIAFLAERGAADSSPVATIERRALTRGNPGSLGREDRAILTWVDEAFATWQATYPIEAPLSDQVRRLLPLAAAVALTDETFCTPGGHPLHRLLDALQAGAVGWQQRLDRAGQMLEQRIERSIEKALDWFTDPTVDLPGIAQDLVAGNERDTARAQRMVQRLVETEEARLHTLAARHDAARFLNGSLETYTLPAAIGEFLKGPWYDSAQLVLTKYGRDSTEWEEMQRATRDLVQSVQESATADEAQREQVLRRLPDDLRRWLLSLEHDTEGMTSAIGLVEYAHLRLLHGLQLQQVSVAPLPVEPAHAVDVREEDEASQTGDWFRFDDAEGELRARLSLRLEGGHHLIFTNFAGLKALDLPRRTFLLRCEEGVVHPLPHRATFSLSLAAAAGIDSEAALRRFLDPEAADYPEVDEEPPDSLELELAAEKLAPVAEAVPEPAFTPEPVPDAAPQPLADAGAMAQTLADPAVEEPPAPEPIREQAPAPPAPTPRERPASSSRGAPGADAVAPFDVPMGAWLGFHDGETPIMAKLAVYDPRRDNYIFVNRKGIALRELNREELLELMDRGLVDILETRSYFREEVQRARAEDS